MKRVMLALVPAIIVAAFPLAAAAQDQPFRTVVDGIVPKAPGLSIQGAAGGCDLMLQNLTGQDVILFDLSKPAKPFRFAAQPKATSPRPPIPVHLTGAWPCASLPAVTEDQRWNHAPATVGSWTLKGAVGALTFVVNARSVYDPGLDPSAEWTFYLRIGIGVLLVGAVLVSVPYLLRRRKEILGDSKKPD